MKAFRYIKHQLLCCFTKWNISIFRFYLWIFNQHSSVGCFIWNPSVHNRRVFMYHVTCNVHHNNMCLWIWTETSIQGEYNGNTRVRMRKRFYGMTSSWSGWWVTMVTALYCGATCWKIPGGRSGPPLIHCWQIKNASLGFASPIQWPLCSPKQHKNHKNSIH